MKFRYYFDLLLLVALHIIGYIFDRNLEANLRWIPWVSVVIPSTLIILFNKMVIKKFYNATYKDALTKLNNKGFFYLKMENEMEKIHTNKQDLALVMIDIDDFKNINDTNGHIAGDEVLRQLAVILKENVRTTDTIFRWGGEEFAIILPKTDTKDAVKLGERVRNAVANHEFCYEIACLRVTVSIGIASINEKMNVDDFVKLADKALYKAKEKKDLVVSF